jgi:hypothetical protein
MQLREMMRLVQVLSKKQGLTVEKYVDAVLSFEDATATVRSTTEERLNTMSTLRDMVDADPTRILDPRDVVVAVGLRQCRADRAFVSYHVRQFQLAHEAKAAA